MVKLDILHKIVIVGPGLVAVIRASSADHVVRIAPACVDRPLLAAIRKGKGA